MFLVFMNKTQILLFALGLGMDKKKKNHSLYDANENGPYKNALVPGTTKAIYYCGILTFGRMAVTLALFLPTAECPWAFKSAKFINLLIRFLCAPLPSFSLLRCRL